MTTRTYKCDAHAHVFRRADVSPRLVDELAPADRDAPVEEFLQLMDQYGVGNAMLVPLAPNDRYVEDCVRRFPGRFVGSVVAGPELQGIDPDSPGPLGALEAIRERFAFRALRTGWLGTPGASIDESPMMPVLKYLSDQGIALWSYLSTEQLPLLDDIARRLPELRVVLNHFGFCPVNMRVDRHARPYFDRGFTDEQLTIVEGLSRHRQIYLMFSGQYALSHQAPPYEDIKGDVRRLAHCFTAERMMWASDFPWTAHVPGYRALLDLPAAMLPDASPAELSAVLGGTAQRFFGFRSERD